MIKYIATLLLLLCLKVTATDPLAVESPPTEESIKIAIKAMTTKGEAIKRFGVPTFISHAGDKDILIYNLLKTNLKEGEHIFSGFELVIENNKIINWIPVYSDIRIGK